MPGTFSLEDLYAAYSIIIFEVYIYANTNVVRYRTVSQELADVIMTMVQTCSLMLSKSTMNRPPPPGVLRHRALEPFNPATLGSQVFKSFSSPIDFYIPFSLSL